MKAQGRLSRPLPTVTMPHNQREGRNPSESTQLSSQDSSTPSFKVQLYSQSFEQHRRTDEDELSGFDPYPWRGQGSRHPRPLIRGEYTQKYSREDGRRFAVYHDPAATQTNSLAARTDNNKSSLTQPALATKDVNEKLRSAGYHDTSSSLLNLTKLSLPIEHQPGQEGSITEEMGANEPPGRQLKFMPSLAEEPAPRFIRAKALSRNGAEARRDRAPQEGEIKSLIAAISDQLSGVSVRLRSPFEDSSAIPEPLNLNLVKNRKRTIRPSKSVGNLRDGSRVTERNRLHKAKKDSPGPPVPTVASLGLETPSTSKAPDLANAERKWYKGFRRFK